MEINPETTELKNMVQNLSDLVVQVSKDVSREMGPDAWRVEPD